MLKPQTQKTTLARARRGDRAAQEAIYQEHAAAVYTLARRMLGSSTVAEDILQETFIDALTKLDSFRGDCELGGWIKKIATNKCLMHLRSAWVSRRADLGFVELPDTIAAGQTGSVDEALAAALDKLPGTARAVVWLHDVEGYTHAEIAEMMQRSTSFSKSQLARARERLRSELADPFDDREKERWVNVSKA